MTTKRDDGIGPGAAYAQEDWDAVDSPEMTEDELARLRPADDVLPPALLANMRRSRGPQKAATKQLVSLRLDRRIIDHYRATGAGWQSRVNAALLKAAGLD